MQDQTTRHAPPWVTNGDEIAEPIYYDDGTVIHACESCLMHPGERLVWTRCDRGVPPGQDFTLEYSTIEVTCPKCLATAP
jgi:hypothetical protein